ncbi:acyl dehydratase [Amycolatopsis sp. NPDC001319]|uniref:acyl dehydratase n=1 Tax=unclassified Amycolatopsis TaxID=2618356 RepID=UPI00368FA9BD
MTVELPPLRIAATTTFVVSTALATRDFQDVHHDRDAAVARGSRDIFLNILTDTGLVQRFVSEWAGPEALIRSIKIRLGVPCYAGDALTFTGHVVSRSGLEVEVAVSATGSLGEHLTGTVSLTLPGGAP